MTMTEKEEIKEYSDFDPRYQEKWISETIVRGLW